MAKLTKEHLEKVKKQLIKQLERFPSEQKSSMESQINSMSDDQLEEFLEKNKLISINNGQQNPFRLIIEGKIPSFKIAENDKAVAVLEVNPISAGHVLIIPKIPYKASKIPQEIQRFAQLMASHIVKILNPRDIQIAVSEMFEEAIINIIPIYEDESFKSERKEADVKELADLQIKLTLPPEKRQTEVIKIPEELEEQEELEKEVKKRKKTPLNKLPKAPKRSP